MKEPKDYFHLYLGCSCILTKSDGGFDTPIVGTHLTLDAHLLFHCLRPDYLLEVKLILRPLSDMTEEEKTGMHGLMWWGTDVVHLFEINSHTPNSIKFLLDKHFDLFGLIESGLAIDKTKLK